MKILFILSANLCFIAGFAQARTSTKKDFHPIENKEINNTQIIEDTLKANRIYSTKKIPVNPNQENNQKAIDTIYNPKAIKAATSKK